MVKTLVKQHIRRYLADQVTPVSIYLRIRDRFPFSLLLESGDYRGGDNSYSYICCDPIAEIVVQSGRVSTRRTDGTVEVSALSEPRQAVQALQDFLASFEVEEGLSAPGILSGVFGYTAYDSIMHFEDIEVRQPDPDNLDIPDIRYALYRYVLAINHFKSEMFLIENETDAPPSVMDAEAFIYTCSHATFPEYPFSLAGEQQSNMTDDEHRQMIEACKKHVARGDIFQIVPSRRFKQAFQGDEFNVYRTLRSINPSPYLFYFDYGSFKIFGSSPEAQILVKNSRASIFPIAGTYRRTGNEKSDLEQVQKLLDDPKENSEHVMLVDLARNDLSKHCDNVKVESFREVQFYSHLIHLVSKVSGNLRSGVSTIEILADTFPAGTLSGAPKYRALELIDQYEKGRRRFYGGALGYLGFNGDCLHAIIIRSFLSKDNVLYSQAGGGVVIDSDTEFEVNEVNTKLTALRAALKAAEGL